MRLLPRLSPRHATDVVPTNWIQIGFPGVAPSGRSRARAERHRGGEDSRCGHRREQSQTSMAISRLLQMARHSCQTILLGLGTELLRRQPPLQFLPQGLGDISQRVILSHTVQDEPPYLREPFWQAPVRRCVESSHYRTTPGGMCREKVFRQLIVAPRHKAVTDRPRHGVRVHGSEHHRNHICRFRDGFRRCIVQKNHLAIRRENRRQVGQGCGLARAATTNNLDNSFGNFRRLPAKHPLRGSHRRSPVKSPEVGRALESDES